MNEQKVRAAIELLEHEVPVTGGRVRFHQYGGGPDESQVVANQSGFLRLGIEFLKAAFVSADLAENPHVIDVSLDYLVTDDSSISFNWFERREDLPQPSPTAVCSPWLLIVFLSIILGVIGFAVIGIVTVVRWLAA
jgi:hypothetical protein